jgi:hypothetical protein
MHIVVVANGEDQKAFQDKEIPAGVIVQFYTSLAEAKDDAELYFFLGNKEEWEKDKEFVKKIQAPILIKEGIVDDYHMPANATILKNWPGTLFDDTIELGISDKNLHQVEHAFSHLGWKFKRSGNAGNN